MLPRKQQTDCYTLNEDMKAWSYLSPCLNLSRTGRGTLLLGTLCFSKLPYCSSQDTALSCRWACTCAAPPSQFSASEELLHIL